MKKIFIYFSLVFLLFSCENENLSNLPDSGLDINLDLNESNFKMTSTFDLNKISIEDIIELTVNELYSQNQSADLYQKNQDSTDEFIDGFDININDDIVIITPIYDDPLEPVTEGACGSGQGWIKYKTCFSEECVKTNVEKASAILSASLESGQCMDLRVRRTLTSAVVCGRVVSC
jgi:hypothetical protein